MRCASLADSPPLMRVRTRGENLYDKITSFVMHEKLHPGQAHTSRPCPRWAHAARHRLAGGTAAPAGAAPSGGPGLSARRLQLHACMSRRAPRAPAPDDGRQTTCHAGAMHTARIRPDLVLIGLRARMSRADGSARPTRAADGPGAPMPSSRVWTVAPVPPAPHTHTHARVFPRALPHTHTRTYTHPLSPTRPRAHTGEAHEASTPPHDFPRVECHVHGTACKPHAARTHAPPPVLSCLLWGPSALCPTRLRSPSRSHA